MTRAADNREEREAQADRILGRAMRQVSQSSALKQDQAEQPCSKRDQPESIPPEPSRERQHAGDSGSR